MKIYTKELMKESGVHFGTSGVRGEVKMMTDFVCYTYTKAFIKFLENGGEPRKGDKIAVAGDLRKSTDRIMLSVIKAIQDEGFTPIYAGKIPTPALALFAMTKSIPGIMITGSHIPDDRNGIKFYKSDGEILKNDEEKIREMEVEIENNLFDKNGFFMEKFPDDLLKITENEAEKLYLDRLPDFFPKNILSSMKVLVYQHSAVGRDILVKILQKLGAEVETFGRSDNFIPVDTEALSAETIDLAREIAKKKRFDAIVTTDGDGDRPLVGDENGKWFKGDLSAILCAKFLEADSVTATLSANTALEKSGFFQDVRRVKIGSPYVIESLEMATKEGFKKVVGFENNGGFMINSDLKNENGTLKALPTRDGVIVIISLLAKAKISGKPVSELQNELPRRFTDTGHLQNFPSKLGKELVRKNFDTGEEKNNLENVKKIFGPFCGEIENINNQDGVRITFKNAEIIHIRPSGNAPEIRCYSEADSEARANYLKVESLKIISELKDNLR